jgi:hypothetical protein
MMQHFLGLIVLPHSLHLHEQTHFVLGTRIACVHLHMGHLTLVRLAFLVFFFAIENPPFIPM